MAESLPSSKTIIADVPEVKDFRTKFVYNFFQPDERINDTGQATKEFIRKRSSESFDAPFIESDQFNRFTARFVRLDWRPTFEPGFETIKPVGFKIADNIEKIHEEQHFIGDSYSNVAFQDRNVEERVKFFVQQLIERQQERDRQSAFDVTSSVAMSPMDTAKTMNIKTSGSVNPALLCEALIQPDQQGYIFRNSENTPIDNTTLLKELRDVRFFSQINNKVLVRSLQSVSENSMSAFKDEIDEFIDEIKNIQELALSEKDSTLIDARDYDLEIADYVDYEIIDVDGHEPRVEIVGYLIEKVEITPEGNAIVHDHLVVENPSVNTTVDVKIKYGTTYRYTIRSIAMFESQADDIDTDETVVVKYLVASKPSAVQIVECIEAIPPPAPVDFNVRWDPIQKGAVLEWCFPVNTQRDIKGWQIFRRASILEPFELQAAYDFDDSVIIGHDLRAEQPNRELVTKMTSPKNFYVDKTFGKNSTYIYAVCSVDARGLGSNYSQQIEASFDRFKNKIKKRLVSPSDAPKSYPNFFLSEDTFVDTIRDSGHKKLRIVFNPEYLNVIDSDANDLKLLRTTDDSKYLLSMINVDLQLQKNIQIKLLDKRRTSEQNTDNIKNKRLLQNRRDVFDRLRKARNKRNK